MSRVVLLLPSSSYRATDFIAAAKALGVDVVVASERRQALSRVMGERALTLPFRRPEQAADALVAHAERLPLHAIVAVDDQGVEVAALAASRLGLPHNSPQSAALTRDKAALRRALVGRVPQPDFRVMGPDDDVAAVAADVGPPVVVKPVSLSASRGVIRADDPEQAENAASRIRRILACTNTDPLGPLLIERYVPGAEVAVEALVRGGRLEILAVFDKPDPLEGPYFEETLYVTPSRLAPKVLAQISQVTSDAATAIGLREGPLHAELRVGDESDVTFLELAARSIGGLCARALRFGLGASLEEVVLRHALGMSLDGLRREPHASGVMMLPIPRAGTFQEIRGQAQARAVTGIVGLEVTVPPGGEVEPLPEGDRYLGFLFARGDSPEEVEASLRAAHDRLEVIIVDPPTQVR